MIYKKLLKYTTVLIIIILSLSISTYGCKNTTADTAEEEDTAGERSASEEDSSLGIDSGTKLKAFETAQVYVVRKYPGASFELGYDEDKVVIESSGLYRVTIDFSSEGSQYNWEILLEYDQQSDSFTVIEVQDTESEVAQESSSEEQPQEEPQQSDKSENKEEPSSTEIKKRAFHAAQADAETMYTDVIFDTEYDESKIKETSENKFEAIIEFEGLGQGNKNKDHFTFKYQLQYDKAKDEINILAKEFVSSYPIDKTLTEEEIKKGAFHAAQEDVLKSYPNAVFASGYSDKLIEALGNNYYQCIIVTTFPVNQFLYLVRYDPNEGKWYTPFKTDSSKLLERSFNAVKHYIETQDSWVQNNCNGVIFDNNSITGWSCYPTEDKWDKFTVKIKFQCQGKDGSLKSYEWYVKTRYDIFSDSFVKFDTSGNTL
jgi:hypothetical protein